VTGWGAHPARRWRSPHCRQAAGGSSRAPDSRPATQVRRNRAASAHQLTLLGWSLAAFHLASAALLAEIGLEWERRTRDRARQERRDRRALRARRVEPSQAEGGGPAAAGHPGMDEGFMIPPGWITGLPSRHSMGCSCSGISYGPYGSSEARQQQFPAAGQASGRAVGRSSGALRTFGRGDTRCGVVSAQPWRCQCTCTRVDVP
jgi:hypothetical protein